MRALLVAAAVFAMPVAFAQAPTPPSPQFLAAQASFEALPEAERKAIQLDLIWAGLFNGAVSGSFGPLTFRAINALKAGRGPVDGMLSPAERRLLAQQAEAARQAAGFRLIADERSGARIGVPEKALPRREALPTGSRWQSADGRVTLDTSASPPGDTLEALFERATAVNPNAPGRRITYKLLRPDFFVITGETPTGRFYRRLSLGPQGLRGFSIGYDKALAPVVDKLVIAIAASFEPFPGGPAPASQPPAVASAPAAAPAQASVPAARPNERYGVALVLADKVVVAAAPAVEGCRALRVGGRPARLRLKDEASGLVLLDTETVAFPVALRAEPPAEGEALVLLAFGDEAGRRVAQALPGQGARIGAGPAVFAPLQPGQSGTPVFDRRGRLAGLVAAEPSGRTLIAGVAPARAHAVTGQAALQGLAQKAGLTLPAATAGEEMSTGAVVEKAGPAALPIICSI